MKVILLEDIEKLGYAGAVKEVKDGYARNYLIPRGKVLPATKKNMKLIEDKQKAIARKIERKLKEAESLREKLNGVRIEIKAKTGEKGRLFGSVTASEISEALKEKGININRKQIKTETIKSIGEYEIPVAIFRDIKAIVKLKVIPVDE